MSVNVVTVLQLCAQLQFKSAQEHSAHSEPSFPGEWEHSGDVCVGWGLSNHGNKSERWGRSEKMVDVAPSCNTDRSTPAQV